MAMDQMNEKDLHYGFLSLEEQMLRTHSPEVWAFMRQGMQAAYYMGALCALRSPLAPAAVFRQAEDGLGDALRIKNMRIIDNQVAPA